MTEKDKRILRKVLIAVGIILFVLVVLLLIAYLIYHFQIKPEQEKVNRANQVADFLDYYDQEVVQDEMAEIETLIKEDEDLFTKLQENKYRGEVGYREIIERRIEIYQQAAEELESAKLDIDQYEKNGEVLEIRNTLSQSLNERSQAYGFFVAGFKKDLKEEPGDEEFTKGKEALERVTSLEKEATEQFEDKMKEILGEQGYQEMVESGEIESQK